MHKTIHTTDIDGADLFSISYPSNWEDILVYEYLSNAQEVSSGQGLDTKGIEALSSVTLLMAGVPTGEHIYAPHINVVRLNNPIENISLNDLVDSIIESSRGNSSKFEIIKRLQRTIDNREATVIDVETNTYYPEMETARQLQAISLKDNTIWIVTCTAKINDYTKYENDFHSIVESLHVEE